MARRIFLTLVAGALVLTALALPGRAEAAPVLVPLTCGPTGPMTPTGSVSIQLAPFLPPLVLPLPQLGQPIADAVSDVELPVPVPIDVQATDEIAPGGTVDYATDLSLDLGTALEDVMDLVRDVLAGAGFEGIAETLRVEAVLDDLTVAFPHPAGTTGTGTPTATGATGATAAHAGGALVVSVDEFTISTETGIDPLDVGLAWSVADGGSTPPATLTQTFGDVDFGFDFEIGGTIPTELIEAFLPEVPVPLPEELPLTAGAEGPWRCTPDEGAPVLASTAVVEDDTPEPPCESGFVDVGPDHLFCADIAWAAGESIVTGYADGTYRPTLPTTRGELAAMLHRFAGSPPVPTGAPTFSDVGPGHTFATAISWAASNGITLGYEDGSFRPAERVTRQEVAAFLHRYAGKSTPEPGGPTFTDVPPGHPFEDAIRWLAAAGITEGELDGTFRPLENVTRQAIAAFFHRYPAE